MFERLSFLPTAVLNLEPLQLLIIRVLAKDSLIPYSIWIHQPEVKMWSNQKIDFFCSVFNLLARSVCIVNTIHEIHSMNICILFRHAFYVCQLYRYRFD